MKLQQITSEASQLAYEVQVLEVTARHVIEFAAEHPGHGVNTAEMVSALLRNARERLASRTGVNLPVAED